jgi:hypothetical protein
MILAAQAAIIAAQAHDSVTIVTTNVRHLDWLAPASLWRDIQFA